MHTLFAHTKTDREQTFRHSRSTLNETDAYVMTYVFSTFFTHGGGVPVSGGFAPDHAGAPQRSRNGHGAIAEHPGRSIFKILGYSGANGGEGWG